MVSRCPSCCSRSEKASSTVTEHASTRLSVKSVGEGTTGLTRRSSISNVPGRRAVSAQARIHRAHSGQLMVYTHAVIPIGAAERMLSNDLSTADKLDHSCHIGQQLVTEDAVDGPDK